MPRNTELLQARNLHVRARFKHHRKRNPRWTIESIIELLSTEVFLSQVMIVKILKANNEKVPDASTICRNKKKAAA